MRKPYQLPGWTKNSSYYSAPVGDRTHDLPDEAEPSATLSKSGEAGSKKLDKIYNN